MSPGLSSVLAFRNHYFEDPDWNTNFVTTESLAFHANMPNRMSIDDRVESQSSM